MRQSTDQINDQRENQYDEKLLEQQSNGIFDEPEHNSSDFYPVFSHSSQVLESVHLVRKYIFENQEGQR